MDVSDVSTLELSSYVNVIRAFLLKKKFFEHHLYSTTPYRIEDTRSFALSNGKFLRYNPEPDIWAAGAKYDKFFWIGSMFRDEPILSDLHMHEFTVADIYIRNTKQRAAVAFFMKIIGELEAKLRLSKLSKFPVQYIVHSEFQEKIFDSNESCWAVVTRYPRNESFYDAQDADATQKFEIFFIDKGRKVEIAACGVLGDNLNESMFVKEKQREIDKKIASKRFLGFGFGIERLIYLYKNAK